MALRVFDRRRFLFSRGPEGVFISNLKPRFQRQLVPRAFVAPPAGFAHAARHGVNQGHVIGGDLVAFGFVQIAERRERWEFVVAAAAAEVKPKLV